MTAQFPRLLRPLWRKVVWHMDASEKVIYLTFDDGPVPEVTPQVLDLLDKYDLKATFFSVGENVQKYPDLYAEVIRRGHRMGNHTFNHLKGCKVSTEEYVENVKKAAGYIDSNLLRPPYGRINFKQLKTLRKEYRIIMWDIITYDYDRKLNPVKILNIVKRFSRNGSVVVFHDSVKAKENMLAVLPQAIEFWKSEGYNFGVL